jgi:hypothetical protein
MKISGTLLVAGTLALAGCRADEPRLAETLPDTAPPIGRVAAGMPAGDSGVEPEQLRQQADALDRQVMELRTHILTMRQLSPAMAANVMDEHAAHVRAVAERVAEQRVALPAPDRELPMLMGMSPDEYGVFVEEIQLASAEVAEMQRGDEATVRARLPGHLDRLDRLAGQLEQAATHMRR